MTTNEELKRALTAFAPEWDGDATSLAHTVLYRAGLTGPTVNTDLLNRTVLLAQHAMIQAALDKPAETPAPTVPNITFPDDPMRAGRLRKVLDKLYRYDDRVATLEAFLSEIKPTHRRDHLRKYARRKRQGCYAELTTPKHEYSVWYWNGKAEVGFEIPKIVFDALTTLPIRDPLGRTLPEGGYW